MSIQNLIYNSAYQKQNIRFQYLHKTLHPHIIFNCISIAVTHSVSHGFMRVNKEHYYMSYKQR